ncbi:GPI maturation protein (Bst1) [Trichuris trichiura]|uniref:GPI maturation protein (Bst1) n=1 Tax=Trichuris trichiura TaxID=36087 RepID=A0A077Z6B1_TRITR|nr:GPI maturation protein (Bst1) [Trichuris trichiura]
METVEPSVFILHENVNVVDVAIRFSGLKPRNALDKMIGFFKEEPLPDRLFKNASFSLWNLSSCSLQLEVTIRSTPNVDLRYRYLIAKFPCEIDVHRSKLKAQHTPRDSHGFLILSLYKREPGCDWKTHLAMHGSLDAR